MKKLYTLLLVAGALTASAQTNLVDNGGFETWVNDNTPENFAPVATPSINNFLTKESTTVHSGSFSAKHQSQDAATQLIEGTELIDVIPGHTYTMSYWYLDNSTTAKSRIWSAWLPADNTTALTDDEAVLRPNNNEAYSVDNAAWVKKELTLTAPAGAGRFRFQVRTYRENTGVAGGFIYYDDFFFADNATAGVTENNISGLKMFPNPVSGSVLNIVSDANATKTVVVYDMVGKQVVNTVTANSTVNVSDLSAGIYMVNITEEGKTATRKLVVK